MASTTVHYTPAQNVTVKAAADLAAGSFVAVSADVDGRNPVVSPAAAGKAVFGVAAHDVPEGGHVMVYRAGHIVDVQASGTVAAGDVVAAASGGKAATAGEGAVAAGVAVSKSADGSVTVAL